MAIQAVNGEELAVQLTAAEAIPFYSLVKFNSSDKTKCNLAGPGDEVIGIAIPDPDMMATDWAGGFTQRTGYVIGDFVKIYNAGQVPVKLGVAVTAGDKCVPMAGGLASKLATDSFTPWNLGASPTNTTINTAGNQTIADIQAAFAARLSTVGRYLQSGAIGDIVLIKVKL